MKHRVWIIALMSAAVQNGLAETPTVVYDHGDPTALEQYMLELINRARLNPTAEGIFLDTLDTGYAQDARQRKPEFFTNLRQEFAAYPVAPPLVFNSQLLAAARLHSQDMVKRKYFDHVTPEGLSPGDRIKNQGYTEASTWGENIAGAGATNADEVLQNHFGLSVDYDNVMHATSPFGHRLNLLNARFKEVGIGNSGAYTPGYITQDFATTGNRIFLVGVVYQDQNGNQFYDPGEGLAGVTVKPSEGKYYAVTSRSGGYAIPLETMETLDVGAIPTVLPANSQWSDVSPVAAAFEKEYLADTTHLTKWDLTVTASGGTLTDPITKTMTLVKPVLVKYQITQTDNVYWPLDFTVGDSAKLDFNTRDGSVTAATSLPDLGDGYSVDSWGEPIIDADVRFAGGIAVNGRAYETRVTQKLADTVDVSGEITVNPAHVGQKADIFVYAESTLPPATETYYFMLGEGLSILAWDKEPSSLVAFIPDVKLAATQKVPMYSGNFIYPGTLKVYFGYRLMDGAVVESNQVIDITINP